MREAILQAGARRNYLLMSDVEQAAVDERLARLERDPTPDHVTTFAVLGAPDIFLYDDGTWQMRYFVPDEATVVVRSIAHALDLPQ